MPSARGLSVAWLALLASACASPGVIVGVGGGGDLWLPAPCDDAAARAAWRTAREAIARGDDRAALPQLQRAIEGCPELVRAHCAYQDAARRLGGDAMEKMVSQYAAAPAGAAPLATYLRARLAETAYAQANDLKRLLEQHPGFGWARLSLARIDRGQGRLAEALRGFERVRRTDPELVEASLERAQVLVELGRVREAARDYEAYLEARPRDLVAVRELVALLLYRLGRVDAATQWLDRLEAAGDRTVAQRIDRAAALWCSGRHRDAVAAYLAILAEAPREARAALNVGLLYYEVVARDEASRRRYWPKARAAFRMFLANTCADDGDERFERTWAVPYRLRRIAEMLGPAPDAPPELPALSWPEEG